MKLKRVIKKRRLKFRGEPQQPVTDEYIDSHIHSIDQIMDIYEEKKNIKVSEQINELKNALDQVEEFKKTISILRKRCHKGEYSGDTLFSSQSAIVKDDEHDQLNEILSTIQQ